MLKGCCLELEMSWEVVELGAEEGGRGRGTAIWGRRWGKGRVRSGRRRGRLADAVVGGGRMGFMIDGISSLPPKIMVVLSLAGFNLKGKDEKEGLELRS